MTNDKITVSRELLRQTIDLLDDMLAPGATFSTASLRAAVEQTAVEPVAWVWNPAKESWERVHVFGHWQSGAIYAFGPEAPQPQQSAPVQEPVNIEQIAAERYKVAPAHESMFYRWAVVAGDGSQQLYIGREVDCQNMARKFAGAFLDGAHLAASQPAPAQEPVPLLTDEEVSHIAVANAIEFHEFARAIEAAVRQKAGIK